MVSCGDQTLLENPPSARLQNMGFHTSPSPIGESEARGAKPVGVRGSIGGEATDVTRPHPNPPPLGEGIKINDLPLV